MATNPSLLAKPILSHSNEAENDIKEQHFFLIKSLILRNNAKDVGTEIGESIDCLMVGGPRRQINSNGALHTMCLCCRVGE